MTTFDSLYCALLDALPNGVKLSRDDLLARPVSYEGEDGKLTVLLGDVELRYALKRASAIVIGPLLALASPPPSPRGPAHGIAGLAELAGVRKSGSPSKKGNKRERKPFAARRGVTSAHVVGGLEVHDPLVRAPNDDEATVVVAA